MANLMKSGRLLLTAALAASTTLAGLPSAVAGGQQPLRFAQAEPAEPLPEGGPPPAAERPDAGEAPGQPERPRRQSEEPAAPEGEPQQRRPAREAPPAEEARPEPRAEAPAEEPAPRAEPAETAPPAPPANRRERQRPAEAEAPDAAEPGEAPAGTERQRRNGAERPAGATEEPGRPSEGEAPAPRPRRGEPAPASEAAPSAEPETPPAGERPRPPRGSDAPEQPAERPAPPAPGAAPAGRATPATPDASQPAPGQPPAPPSGEVPAQPRQPAQAPTEPSPATPPGAPDASTAVPPAPPAPPAGAAPAPAAPPATAPLPPAAPSAQPPAPPAAAAPSVPGQTPAPGAPAAPVPPAPPAGAPVGGSASAPPAPPPPAESLRPQPVPAEIQNAPVQPGQINQSDARVQTLQQPVEVRPITQEQGERIREVPRYDLPPDARVVKRDGDRQILSLGAAAVAGAVAGAAAGYFIRSNDDDRLGVDATERYSERLSSGRTRETIVRPNGVEIVTVTNRYGDVVRRSRITPDGRETVLFFDPYSEDQQRPDYYDDPGRDLPPIRLDIPEDRYVVDVAEPDERLYYDTLVAPPVETVERIYSVDEVRRSNRIRDKVRRIDLATVNFDFASASIAQSQVAKLQDLAEAIKRIVDTDPGESFLIEGHTDAVGSNEANLVLSDKRAEAVAAALSQYFDVPAENLVTQGYGEQELKVNTQAENRENRRVTVRRITALVKPVATSSR